MELELKYDYAKTCYKKKVAKSQCVVECNLLKPEGAISKLLCNDANAKITGFEAVEGEIKFDMRVDFCAIINDENGTVDSLSYSEYVSDSIKNSAITANANAQFKCQIVDMQTLSMTNNKLVLQCVVEIMLCVLCEEEIKYLADTGCRLINKKQNQNITSLVCSLKEKFTCNEKFEHKGEIDKVLLSQSQCKIKKVGAGLDCIIVEGEILCNVVFCNYENSCAVFSKQFCIAFEREFEAHGVRVDNKAIAQVIVDTTSITVNVEQKEECIIDIKVDLMCNASAFACAEIMSVSDLFSLTDELEIVRNCHKTMWFEDDFYSVEKINGVANIAENMPAIDKLLSPMCSNVLITNLTCFDGYVLCEGIVCCSVAYCSEDIVHSTFVEMPYSVTIKNPCVKTDSLICAEIVLTDIMARHKKTDCIDVYAEVLIDISVRSIQHIVTITDVTVSEQKPECKAGMCMYIARENEEMFEVAKSLNVSVAAIIEQNGELNDPLQVGDKVIVYRQKYLSEEKM